MTGGVRGIKSRRVEWMLEVIAQCFKIFSKLTRTKSPVSLRFAVAHGLVALTRMKILVPAGTVVRHVTVSGPSPLSIRLASGESQISGGAPEMTRGARVLPLSASASGSTPP